jgi:hypothetical protein
MKLLIENPKTKMSIIQKCIDKYLIKDISIIDLETNEFYSLTSYSKDYIINSLENIINELKKSNTI